MGNLDKHTAIESAANNKDATNKKISIKQWMQKLNVRKYVSTKKRKAITVSVAAILVMGILSAIPTTRYGLLGWAVKKDVTIVVMDARTKKPISDAVVTVGPVNQRTDSKGVANLKAVSVGQYRLKIAKRYYKEATMQYTVPVVANPKKITVNATATGLPVSFVVTHAITKAPIAAAKITISGTTAVTDASGRAVIVLPADKPKQKGTVAKDSYRAENVEVTIATATSERSIALTPAGNVYFLSKSTGKINVMKSDLDGENASVVVTGTGQENDHTTVLLAARDWRYMALLAQRDGDKDTLYLIDAATNLMTKIDEGAESYELVGWSGHNFVYKVNRIAPHQWDDRKQALKSYDAESGQIVVLDQTRGAGTDEYNYKYELISSPYILDNEIIYTKGWEKSYYTQLGADDKKSIISTDVKGNKKIVKEWPQGMTTRLEARLYEPQSLYVRVHDGNVASYYEYEDGAVKAVSSTNDSKYYGTTYNTYLVSPSGQKTFWYEARDGKNTLFVGDKNGESSKQVATLSEYQPFGWYSDEYLLMSKNGSELYVVSAREPLSDRNVPIKVTDYHKPRLLYPGYGYGYGGQ